MTVDRTTHAGSDTWQPEVVSQNSTELSRHLEQASRAEGMQRVAECALDLMSPLTMHIVAGRGPA